MLKLTRLRTHVRDGICVGWDESLPQFPNSSYDQAEFLAASLWGGHRLSKLTVTQDNRPVAAAQLVLFRLTSSSWGPGIAYLKAGPMWLPDRVAASSDLKTFVFRALIDEYARRRGLCLTVAPALDTVFERDTIELMAGLGFELRRDAPSPDRYLVNLCLSEDEQRRSLSQKWRHHLRRAEAERLQVREQNNEAGVATFMRLHADMLKRKAYHDESWAKSFPQLYPAIPEPMRPRVHLAFEDDVPVAGIVVGEMGQTAFYLFGATSERGLQTRAGYILHWFAIKQLSLGQQMKWYDLDSDAGEPGLRQFKRGLIGKRGTKAVMPGEYDYCVNPVSAATARLLQIARSIKPRLRA